eukprot:jgi/Chlat1/9290/Chrsp99S08494
MAAAHAEAAQPASGSASNPKSSAPGSPGHWNPLLVAVAAEPLRRAVTESTAGVNTPKTSEALRLLGTYLSDSTTVDFAYYLILERATAERKRSVQVLTQCVELLKRNLLRHVPTTATLRHIDAFCLSTINSIKACSTAAKSSAHGLVKSLTYVRALVARHISSSNSAFSPTFAQASRLPVDNPLLTPTSARTPLAVPTTFLASPVPSPSETFRLPPDEPPALLPISPNEQLKPAKQQRSTFLLLRWALRDGETLPLLRATLGHSPDIKKPRLSWLSGETANSVSNAGDKSQDSTFAIDNSAAYADHIKPVAAAKRKQQLGESGPASIVWKGRGAQLLFQYRCYSEQAPLRLSHKEVAEVIAAVCTDASEPGIIHNVLIKILMDMYLVDPQVAAPLTLSLLQDMLSSSSVGIRVRAFDLLLNLGVHAHLLVPPPDPEPLSSAASPTRNEIRSRAAAVRDLEDWLWRLLEEMLLFVTQVDESVEEVWAAAVSGMLYLATRNGAVDYLKFQSVDIRALRALLDIAGSSYWPPRVQQELIQIAAHSSYVVSVDNRLRRRGSMDGDGLLGTTELDLNRVERLGGIKLICEQYAAALSLAVQKTLFAVLFDCALGHIRLTPRGQELCSSEADIRAVFTSLVAAELPEFMASACKLAVAGMCDGVAQFVVTAVERKEKAGKFSSKLLKAVVSELQMLAIDGRTVDKEFQSQIAATLGMNDTEGSSGMQTQSLQAWGNLRALLCSDRYEDRANGTGWLFELLAGCAGYLRWENDAEGVGGVALGAEFATPPLAGLGLDGDPDVESKEEVGSTTRSRALQVLCELLEHPNPVVRSGYLTVVERLLLLQQISWAGDWSTQSQAANGPAVDEVISAMNEGLGKLVAVGEKDTAMLLRMCNVMLLMVSASRDGAAVADENDMLVTRLLTGQAHVPKERLARIGLRLLHWPYVQLASAKDHSIIRDELADYVRDMRVTLLLLLIHRCSFDGVALTAVGGESFFRLQMDDHEPRVAYFASAFLLHKIRQDRCSEYRGYLHQLVLKAQQVNDEKLLEIPYLQMTALYELQLQAQQQKSQHQVSQAQSPEAT